MRGVLLGLVVLLACEAEVTSPDVDTDRARAIWEQARERGVSFRGVGQEPGWLLELTGERALFEYDYGERRLEVSALERALGPEGETVLRADGLVITIVERECLDTMSGEEFPSTVTVTLEDRSFAGCGRVP